MAMPQLGRFNTDPRKWKVKMLPEGQQGLSGLEVSLGYRPKQKPLWFHQLSHRLLSSSSPGQSAQQKL